MLSGEEKPALPAGPCLPSGAMGRTLWMMWFIRADTCTHDVHMALQLLSPAFKKWDVWGLDLMDLTTNPETCTHRH